MKTVKKSFLTNSLKGEQILPDHIRDHYFGLSESSNGTTAIGQDVIT
ncbi:MAG TPA: hypothetical protein VEI28_03835 [Thermodesulfovibrionales bacterium]|nr:hypothetical protein [Thermodesulfovibrionales bacterium]